MEVTYSAAIQDVDQAAHAAKAERPDQPVKLRVQPTLIRVNPETKREGHAAWPGVSWNLTLETAEEAIQVKAAMEALFAALTRVGPAAVIKALTPRG